MIKLLAIGVFGAALAGPALAQQSLAAMEELRVSQSEADAVPADSIRRVTADLAPRIGTWTGVRSCGDPARAEAALKGAFNSWIGEQVTGNPGKKLLRVGAEGGPWWFENRTRSGKRSCKGGFHSAKVYADLY